MPFDRTRLRARLYDRQRARQGYSADLGLVTYDGETGYGTPTTLTEGWNPERTTDQPTGEQFFDIYVAETAGDLTDTFANVTAVTIDGLYYKIKGGIVPPTGGTRVWNLRCEPTGTEAP
jgi:hypothetical protein